MATNAGPQPASSLSRPRDTRDMSAWPYKLDGVEDLDEVIGHGSYAAVKKLKFRGLECVGKKMHDILYLNTTPQQREDMLIRFQGECELLSRLHHPCIVQFMGMYFEEGTPLPVLVMERLHSTLAATIDRYGVLPDQISYDILCDVSLGLRYLHEHSPPIVHRDLSANNVLLTPNMSGKISDLGVAKMLNLSPAQMTQLVQTKAPGTPCYMPPEAFSFQPKYNTKIDIYSMGVMLIHVFCGEWPFPTDAFQPDPRNLTHLVPVTEVRRRAEFLRKIGDDHPLTPLMHSCLSNSPTLRPDAAQVYVELSKVKGQLPAKDETRIELIRQLQSSRDETVTVRKDFEKQVTKLKKENEALKKEKKKVDAQKDKREEEVEQLRKQMRDVSLSDSEKNVEVQLLHPLSKLQWKRCASMPVKMYNAQAVAVGNEVYVGGGDNNTQSDLSIVFKYNMVKDEWSRLQPHLVLCFGLCQFQGKLLTVGGWHFGPISAVYRYSQGNRKWVESLKPMPTERSLPALLTTASAIVACGGYIDEKGRGTVALATVEVYSSTTSQWYTADLLPQPCTDISPVTISRTGFLLGGLDTENEPIKSPFCVDMATLIDRATSPTRRHHTSSPWKTLPDTPLKGSAAATLSGGLLAMGGDDDIDRTQAEIYLLTPSTNIWVKLPSGQLPAKRYECTTAQLSSSRVMVMGGLDSKGKDTSTCYIASVVV